jgi:hypothetical protein
MERIFDFFKISKTPFSPFLCHRAFLNPPPDGGHQKSLSSLSRQTISKTPIATKDQNVDLYPTRSCLRDTQGFAWATV